MGLFGGGNSSSATTNVTNTTSTDSRVVADAGSTVLNSGGGGIQFTDSGAVVQALDFARGSAALNSKSLAELIGLSKAADDSNRQTVQLLASQSNDAFGKFLDATDRALTRISASQAATVDRFAGLAEAGIASARYQAGTLADAFAVASGKSANPVLIIGGLALAAFVAWKYAR